MGAARKLQPITRPHGLKLYIPPTEADFMLKTERDLELPPPVPIPEAMESAGSAFAKNCVALGLGAALAIVTIAVLQAIGFSFHP